MTKVCIGKIINTHGLKGEVKIESYSDFDEMRYQTGKTVYIFSDNEFIPMKTKGFHYHKGFPHVSFEDYEDINRIEKYKGCLVYVDAQSRQPLKKDEFYQTDLIGLNAYDDLHHFIGRVKDVEPTRGAQNNLRIEQEDGTSFLVPYINEFIRKVDLDQKEITIHMEEGLL